MTIEGALYLESCIFILKPLPKKKITTTASEERLLRNPSDIPGADCTDELSQQLLLSNRSREKIQKKRPFTSMKNDSGQHQGVLLRLQLN